MDPNGWNAIYADGSRLKRYDKDGTERSYQDIDRDNLKEFEVTYLGVPTLKICFERPSQRLIYRRRCFTDALGNMLPDQMIILAGWQENIGGKSIKCINYVYPDGHIELDGSRDDLVLLPVEE